MSPDPDAALDDPVGASLRGAHAAFARRHGAALSYLPSVTTFCALPQDPSGRDWDDLAALLGPGALADLFSLPAVPPAGWEPVFRVPGLQLVLPHALEADEEVVELGPPDTAEVRALVGRTRPGPFWRRTTELGRYVGVREQGRLVAVAGERLRPPGWTELSAVCTDEQARGRRLAERLVRALAVGAQARGEQVLLHVRADNVPALRLYERLGFAVRAEVAFTGYRVPGGA